MIGLYLPALMKPQELLPDKVRRTTVHDPQSYVDTGFAEVDGRELGVTVGEMQKAHIAVFRDVIEFLTLGRGHRGASP